MNMEDEYMDATLQINAFGLSAGGLRLFTSWGTYQHIKIRNS